MWIDHKFQVGDIVKTKFLNNKGIVTELINTDGFHYVVKMTNTQDNECFVDVGCDVKFKEEHLELVEKIEMEKIKADNIVVGNSYIVRNFQNALKIKVIEKTKESIKIEFLDSEKGNTSRYFNNQFDSSYTVVEDLGNESMKIVEQLIELNNAENLEKRSELGM